MHTFGCKTEVAINNGKFFRRYPAVTIGADTPLDKLIVDTGGESKLVRDHFNKLDEEKKKTDETFEPVDQIQLVMESHLTPYEHLPARIGRVSAKLLSNNLHVHEELMPLDVQCDILKSKKPKKTHFRFAVVSGFGANLGDCTIGITAMREAANFLATKFDSFSIDFLFGPGANGTNADIVGFEPWIGQVFFEGPTLQDFARYDAYFDFTGLITLPRFTEMPTMDWYMWWMGLNPATVLAEKKRNRMTIRWDAWDEMARLLRSVGGEGKRILFNPKASVPVRSFPPEVAVEFAKKLLAADTKLQLVIDQPLDLKHKRLVDLSGKVNSPAKFIALIPQLDGVITVDSFASHMVDTCSLPAVSIHSTLPAKNTPYYPFLSVVEIPDAEKLPAWNKCKFNTEEEWLEAKEAYTAAWQKLEPKKILKLLEAKIKQRNEARGEPRRITFTDHSPKFEATKIYGGLNYLKYDYPSAFWLRSQQRLAALSSSVLKVGMTAVLVGAGQSGLPVNIAKALGSLGVLHVFEPRWQRRTLITNDIVAKSTMQKLHWHDAIPAAGCKKVNINDNDPFGESNPEEWGNSRRQVEVNALTIDALELTDCHAIFLTPPTPWKLAIDGLLETVKKCRPFLFFAPISKNDAHQVVLALDNLNYQFWAEPALEHGNLDTLIMLGFPSEQKVNTAGFARINLQ